MILDAIENLGGWTWWIVGLVLLGLEILLPGTFFLWFGIAAIIVGAISLLTDIIWQVELVIFAALAGVLVIFGRRYFLSRAKAEPDAGLNQRGERLVGSVYILHEPIVDGVGRIRVGDSNWRVSGPDTPSGHRVEVTGTDGPILKVRPLP